MKKEDKRYTSIAEEEERKKMFGTKVNHWNKPKQSKTKPPNELPVAVATKMVQSSPKKEMRDDISKRANYSK